MSLDIINGRRLVGLFVVGMVLFNYPLLTLFDRPILVLGIPILILYLFGVWMLIILLTLLISQSKPRSRSSDRRM